MTTVATIDIVAQLRDNVSKGISGIGDNVRYFGARMRNAGIGMTIAFAPVALMVKSMAQDAMELEAVSRGIGVVSAATGRDVADVMAVINKHSGELMTKLDLTRGVLKLLSTSLSEVQIDQFIVMVKNGAAAMGEDMSTAFNMVSKGLKTYRMQNFDMIGVNERMIEIYKKVNRQLSDSETMFVGAIEASEDLTSAQKDAIIEQTIFTEVSRKAGVYTGIYAEYMRSTMGKVASFTTRIKDLSATFGHYMLPSIVDLMEKLEEFAEKLGNMPEKVKAATGELLFMTTIVGGLSAVFLMLGGNLVWAIGQLMHIAVPGVLIATLLAFPYFLYKIIETIAELQYALWDLADALMVAYEEPIRTTLNSIKGFVSKIGTIIFDEINKYIGYYNAIMNVVDASKKIEPLKWEDTNIKKAIDDALSYDNALEKIRTNQDRLRNQIELYKKYPFGIGAPGILGEGIGDKEFDPMGGISGWFGAQGKGILDMYGKMMLNLIPAGEGGAEGVGGAGAGGVAGRPTFTPPSGGMPMGNLIIILPPVYGAQYGSQLNLGAWSSLMEKSGQDVIINAGTHNKPII